MRRLLTLALCLAPAVASAQIYVDVRPPLPPPPPVFVPPPPRVVVAPPPVYAPPQVYQTPPSAWVPPPPPLGSVPPHVYIRERIRWHLRRHFAPRVVVVQAPPQVVVEAPPPPVVVEAPQIPPPIVAPAPRIYIAPPMEPAPEIVVVRPLKKPVPQWASRFGLGVRGTGQVIDSGWDNLGIGGEFLYRASPHLVTELAAEYQRSPDGPLARTDIPVTIGLRVHIGRPNWVVSPYFVFAGGIDIGLLDYKFATDTAFYVDGQLGGGLELRLGQHVAITADARLDGRKRVNDPAENIAATRSVNGKPVHALGDEYGGQFRLGIAAYF